MSLFLKCSLQNIQIFFYQLEICLVFFSCINILYMIMYNYNVSCTVYIMHNYNVLCIKYIMYKVSYTFVFRKLKKIYIIRFIVALHNLKQHLRSTFSNLCYFSIHLFWNALWNAKLLPNIASKKTSLSAIIGL